MSISQLVNLRENRSCTAVDVLTANNYQKKLAGGARVEIIELRFAAFRSSKLCSHNPTRVVRTAPCSSVSRCGQNVVLGLPSSLQGGDRITNQGDEKVAEPDLAKPKTEIGLRRFEDIAYLYRKA